MKTIRILALATALGLAGWTSLAQAPDGAKPGRPGRGERPPGARAEAGPNAQRPAPRSPLIQALDANRDGELDASEIANAASALKALDANGDGRLTREELRPPRPARTEGEAQERGEGRPEGRRGAPRNR